MDEMRKELDKVKQEIIDGRHECILYIFYFSNLLGNVCEYKHLILSLCLHVQFWLVVISL